MGKKETFEASLHGLEEAVARLEGGELSLEEALRSFEQGVRCATRCRESLKAVESRVEQLLKGRDGALTLDTFDQE